MWYYIFKGKKPKKCKKLPKIPQMKMPFIIEKMGRAICLYRAKKEDFFQRTSEKCENPYILSTDLAMLNDSIANMIVLPI